LSFSLESAVQGIEDQAVTAVRSQFVIRKAASEELSDLNTLIVALSEDPNGEGDGLQFMRTLRPSQRDRKQDRALGLDTYCLALPAGDAVVYGGLVACALTDSELRLELTPEAARELDVAQNVTMVLEIPPEEKKGIAEILPRVLASSPKPVALSGFD
jgi:hypothetical protein